MKVSSAFNTEETNLRLKNSTHVIVDEEEEEDGGGSSIISSSGGGGGGLESSKWIDYTLFIGYIYINE